MFHPVLKGNGAWDENPNIEKPAARAACAMARAEALPSQKSQWVW
jgi:hypothetical protein